MTLGLPLAWRRRLGGGGKHEPGANSCGARSRERVGRTGLVARIGPDPLPLAIVSTAMLRIPHSILRYRQTSVSATYL